MQPNITYSRNLQGPKVGNIISLFLKMEDIDGI